MRLLQFEFRLITAFHLAAELARQNGDAEETDDPHSAVTDNAMDDFLAFGGPTDDIGTETLTPPRMSPTL